MSRFHIGQRVRALGWNPQIPGASRSLVSVPAGSVGTVASLPYCDGFVCVVFDGIKSEYTGSRNYPAGSFSRHEASLAPIDDDDSRKVVSWSQCVWKPNQVRA